MKFVTFFLCLSVFVKTQAKFPFGPRTDCKIYCMSEKQFVFCDGVAASEERALYTCLHEGEFCDPNDASYCSKNVPDDVKQKNSQCGKCVLGATGHSCVSMNSFKMCKADEDGTAIVSGDEKKCKPGFICDAFHYDPNNPCRRFTGAQLLCWEGYKEPTDADRCKKAGKEGNHEIEGDTTCTKFLACSRNESAGEWSGRVMTCQPNTFYDPKIRVCVPPVIFKCPTPPAPPAEP